MFTCKQEDSTVQDFATQLYNLSLQCNFGTLCLELVKDLFIAGLAEKRLQFMLLKEKKMDIDKAVNMCKMAELSQKHVENMHGENTHSV